MAVLLLWERRKGRGSSVWGYIEQLPSSIDTPVRWEEADLAELQYQPAIKEVPPHCSDWLPLTGSVDVIQMGSGSLHCMRCALPDPGRSLPCPTHPAKTHLPLRPQIKQQQTAWRQQFNRFCAAVRPGQGNYSWDNFLWAAENVRSRAFSGPYTGSSGMPSACLWRAASAVLW